MIASLGIGMQADSSGHQQEYGDDTGRADEFGGDVDDRFDDLVGEAGEDDQHARRRNCRERAPHHLNSPGRHAPLEPPRLSHSATPGGGRCAPRRPRLLPGVPAPLPRQDRSSAPLLGPVRPVGRLRRPDRGHRLCRLRALPEVVALRQRPRLPHDRPRRRRRQRDRRRPLHCAEALRARPAALGRGDGLPAHALPGRRRPPRRAPDRRAADPRPPPAQARGAGHRRRLGRPDGRPRDAPQPEPGRDRDRLRRRRRAQTGNADARPQGAGDDGADRDDPRRDRARRGGDRDPLGSRHAAGQGRRRLSRARGPRAHPADRVRAAARRRPAQQAAARGPGRGRARPRPDRGRAGPGRRLPARPASSSSPAPAARSAPSSAARSPGSAPACW